MNDAAADAQQAGQEAHHDAEQHAQSQKLPVVEHVTVATIAPAVETVCLIATGYLIIGDQQTVRGRQAARRASHARQIGSVRLLEEAALV